ncbi:MAG: hypothetical protein HC913_12445 [Microscillaceae bacterium]|nr:hypothetical protein [Microscillaceae bacterium]
MTLSIPLFLGFCVFFSLPWDIRAQSLTRLSRSEVRIINTSYMDVEVFIRYKGQRWKRKSIKAEAQLKLEVRGQQPLCKVSTPGLAPHTIVYRLEGGKEYQIYWYRAKMRLDIDELEARLLFGPASAPKVFLSRLEVPKNGAGYAIHKGLKTP